jgi:hypothetical protein
LALEVV